MIYESQNTQNRQRQTFDDISHISGATLETPNKRGLKRRIKHENQNIRARADPAGDEISCLPYATKALAVFFIINVL